MRSGTQPGHHAGQKSVGLRTALTHDTRERFSPASGLFSVTAYRLGRRQGKTPMQPCIQPGYHAMQKAAGLGAATGARHKGRLSPVSGADFHDCVQARANKEGSDAVRHTAGPSCQAKKNPPASPGDRFYDRGTGDQRNWVPLISSLKERSRYSAARLESIMRVRKISK